MAYILKTKTANLHGVATKGFPVIFNENGNVHWLSLNYFLDSLISTNVSSLGTYSRHLVDFFSQLEMDFNSTKVDFIDDDYLIAYKSALISRDEDEDDNTENYGSQVIRTVIHYFYWLETNKYTRNLIGETDHHRIRIKKTISGLTHELAKDKSKDKKTSIAPRTEWIEIVKRNGPQNQRASKRFELMIDFGRTAGLRAFEACGLTISRLPSRETVQKAIAGGKNVFMLLNVTKGGMDKNIPVSPVLIKKAWEYIDIERSDLVSIFKKRSKEKYESYEEPKEIFLSEKTGKALSSTAFSNSIRTAFLAAVTNGELTEDERVWCHGLRHNFSVTLLRRLDDSGVNRPEAITRQATRHGSEDALEPYLTDRYNDDFN